MAAVVPQELMPFYTGRNLLGRVFSLNHFQIEYIDYEYPRHYGYTLIRDNWMIRISNNTQLNQLEDDMGVLFPLYPTVPSIRTLVDDITTRRMMIGNLISII